MVNIQWYPGHMEKARRDMQDSLKAVDMIIEVRDARIPLSSANPMLDQMAQGKPRLILLSKRDLADEDVTKQWIDALSKEDRIVIACDIAKDPNVKKTVVEASKKLTEAKRQRMIKRGIRPRAMRAMACGIPNAGKSTLINRIAGRKSAKTEDRPGVTRSLTWIHADASLEILDTPGVLWPKFSDPRVGSKIAAVGSINEDILDLKSVAMDTMHIIRKDYPGLLENEFHCEQSIRTDRMLDEIARERHLLKNDGAMDADRAASLFLHELRRGAYGGISLERPDEEDNKDLSE